MRRLRLLVAQFSSQWPYWNTIVKFKPVNGRYKPVDGGRWSVRKIEDSYGIRTGKLWRAWTRGTAKKFDRRFHTQEEAFRWAERVAKTYRLRDTNELKKLYSEKYPKVNPAKTKVTF